MSGLVASVWVPNTPANGNANPSKAALVGAVNVCATAAIGYLFGRNIQKFRILLDIISQKDMRFIKVLQDWLALASTKSIRHRVW